MSQAATQVARVKAQIQAIVALSDTIRELGSVPSGHLYAQVMQYMTIDFYNSAIGILKNAKVVEESDAHLLTWIGPAKESSNG